MSESFKIGNRPPKIGQPLRHLELDDLSEESTKALMPLDLITLEPPLWQVLTILIREI